MQIKQYFEIVRTWWWLVVVSALLAGGAAYVVSRQQPNTYQAATTLLVNQTSNPGGIADAAALTVSGQLAKTYSQLLLNRPLMEETITQLGLSLSPTELAKKVTVAPVRDTQLLVVTVEDTDPALAAALANKIPELFIRNIQDMQAGRRTAAKDSLAAEIDKLEKEIATLETTLGNMGNPIDEYDKMERSRLQDTLARYRSNWSRLLDSYQQLVVAEAQTTDSVVAVEPAKVPDEPIGPKTSRNTMLAVLLGAMLGLGAAFLIEYLDDSIKSSDDVQTALGLPTLGAIGHLALDGADHILVAAERPRASVAETLRVLRANIQFLGVDHPVRSILITSSCPREGKSMVTANLGVVLAQAGASVIIVDADLRRPTQHSIFGLSHERGLTNVLVGQQLRLGAYDTGSGGHPPAEDVAESPASDLDDYLQPTAVANLRLLATGPIPPNPADLLASRRMRQLMGELAQRADVVLFDSPPALLAADANLLANQVDGTLLIVENGSTPRGLALQAKQGLEKTGGRLLGVALNKLSRRSANYYYYSQYYGQEKVRKKGKRPRSGSGRQAGSPATAAKRLVGKALPESGHYAADGR